MPPDGRTLVIACGALANELVALRARPGLDHLDLACLPAALHDRPERIPDAVRRRIQAGRATHERIFVAYADCGTGGLLDRVLREEGVERLPGAHCYQVFAGEAAFDRLMADEPATFFLTDFLARNFERLVVRGLGLERHPELETVYFGGYRRLVYLAQTEDADLRRLAQGAADRLGLTFELRLTGYGGLAAALEALAGVADVTALRAAPPAATGAA
ncbi:MAG: DUF1638 domain-containing protein [Candidatus Limnocylindrales bacterium]